MEAPIVIEKKAHTLTAHAKVDSTCTETGTEAYWTCDVCEKLFSDEEAETEIEEPIVIEKKPHTLTAHAKGGSHLHGDGHGSLLDLRRLREAVLRRESQE